MTDDAKALIVMGVVFGPFILSGIYGLYMTYYGATGKHHLVDGMMSPPGQVWLYREKWWTFTRLRAECVERRFDKRSNPLDEELIYDVVAVPGKSRRIPREREY